MMKNPVATGQLTKLQMPFSRQPLVIVGVGPSDIYRVRKLNESGDRGLETTANFNQLKIWTGFEIESADEMDDVNDNESNKGEKNYMSETSDVSESMNDVDNAIMNEDSCKTNKTMNIPVTNVALDQTKVYQRPIRDRRKPKRLNDYI